MSVHAWAMLSCEAWAVTPLEKLVTVVVAAHKLACVAIIMVTTS